MSSPRITIGMATCNDFEGVWCTLQSIFLHNEWESPDDVQIIIIDTSPIGSEHRNLVQGLVAKSGHSDVGCRTNNIKYIDRSDLVGTTASREAIFEAADAPYVCVMDCHVMLRSNALLKLLTWFEANPTDDLIHGPLVYDNLHTLSSQFDDQFRGGMWGTWGTTWEFEGTHFVCMEEAPSDTPNERSGDGLVKFYNTITLAQVYPSLPENIPWGGHEQVLLNLGCVELARDDEGAPFEIPGCGMGLFASKRSSWLHFAANCSGFGGEEMNIHYRYRLEDRKTICLPFLKWNHRFGRVGGAPYPTPLYGKIRNYLLWAAELGNPLCANGKTLVQRIRQHFPNLPDDLLTDPLNFPINLTPVRATSSLPIQALYAEAAANSPDLNGFAEYISNLVFTVQSVRAFVKRAVWEPVLLSGYPNYLEVFQADKTDLIQTCHNAVKQKSIKDHRQIKDYNTHVDGIHPEQVDPIEVDLLVLDLENNGPFYYNFLTRHGVHAAIIMLRGTQTFGLEGEGGGEGVFSGIKQFLKENPSYFVTEHMTHNYGMTTLTNIPSLPEKPAPWPIGFGPGTELKKIFVGVGINSSSTCACTTYMNQMDAWGDECEIRVDEIASHLKEQAEAWGWNSVITKDSPEALSISDKVSIGWKSITSGLAFKLNWLNPYPGLVREAIKRSRRSV